VVAVLNEDEVTETTYYTRDAQGNVLAAYTYKNDTHAGTPAEFLLSEVPLYGSSRLGEWRPRRLLDIVAAENTVTTLSGEKTYELSNHLGNVLAVVSDELSPFGGVGGGEANVVSATDYYAFGQEMPGRTFASEDYRYGFNGKENDREWGESLIQDYGMRLYNPALCRFLSVDPLYQSYPWNSTYAFAENEVISCIDVDGGAKGGNPGGATQTRPTQQPRNAPNSGNNGGRGRTSTSGGRSTGTPIPLGASEMWGVEPISGTPKGPPANYNPTPWRTHSEVGSPGFEHSEDRSRRIGISTTAPSQSPYTPGMAPSQTNMPSAGTVNQNTNIIWQIEVNRLIRADVYIQSKQGTWNKGPQKYEVYGLYADKTGWYTIEGNNNATYTQQYYGVGNSNVHVNTTTGQTQIYVPKGTLLKYGQTADPAGRYTDNELKTMGVTKTPIIANVTESHAKALEKALIVTYPSSSDAAMVKTQTGLNLLRPAKNKIDK
jgi:RHS repeat-associated protein